MQYDHRAVNTQQLASTKQNILARLPGKQLKQYLDFQESQLEQSSCCWRLFSLCSCTYPRVDPAFKQGFCSLDPEERHLFYAKNLNFLTAIISRRSRIPESTFEHEEADGLETDMVDFRYGEGGWQGGRLTVEGGSKMVRLEPGPTLNLHNYLVRQFATYLQLQPIHSGLQEIQIRSGEFVPADLFQRLEKLTDDCLEERLLRMIGEEKKVRLSETEEVGISQRGTLEEKELTLRGRKSEVRKEMVNYLKFYHLVEPMPLPEKVDVMGGGHCLLQADWRYTSDGELIAINEQKLDAQTGVIKFIIKRLLSGTKVFHISLPVTVFHQHSNLSLLLTSYRYAPLILSPSALDPSPLARFLATIKFALTCPSCYIRCDKPFNPILGETYQSMVAGALFYGEQISHHPPISAVFVKGVGFTLSGSFEAEVEFGLNSAAGNNRGWLKVAFQSPQQVVRFNNCPGEMSGMIFGKRKLALINSVYFIDESNRLFCELVFGKVRLQSKVKTFKDSVEGRVCTLRAGVDYSRPEEIGEPQVEKVHGLVTGQWLGKVLFNGELLMDAVKMGPPQIDRYLAMLESDYSLREDIILKTTGSIEECQTAKQKLEEIQRNDRKLREKYAV